MTSQDQDQQEPSSIVDTVADIPFNLEEYIAENANSSTLDLSCKGITSQNMSIVVDALRKNPVRTEIF